MTTSVFFRRAARFFPALLPLAEGLAGKLEVAGKSNWWKPLAILCCLVNVGSAATFELFTYTDNGSFITIIDYPTTAVGEVTIPSTIISKPVTSIGANAFNSCTGLTGVTIPESVTNIGTSAFYNCTGLTSVTIPNSVTSIGTSAFQSCSGLTSVTIPNSVTGIGSQAFYSCTGLTSVTIPNSVTSIGTSAFASCTGLISVTVDPLNSIYGSLDGVMFNKNMTTLIQCPGGKAGSYTIPDSVTSIGINAFYYCSGLTSVTIPNSVTSIGTSAFYYCHGMTSMTIPDSVTSIGISAFQSCAGLTSVTIPDSVTSIGSQAFRDCSGLTSVAIGSSVTSIGTSAFFNCTGLTSVTIPNSVTSIGTSAFQSCTGLTSITIPNSVTIIGTSVFQSCSGLISVTIPNNVTSIGTSAFQSCSGLTSVTIPNNVTNIGSQAFLDCLGLTSVTIPNSVTSIGTSAFLTCPNLLTIYIKGNAPSLGTTVFSANSKSNVYYLSGTTGWTSTYGGLSTVALGLPTINGQPSDVIANAGENAAFSVIAKTTFPLTLSYQWQRNGLVIPSATAASLYLNNLQSANVGTYTVIVTNDTGSVSRTATLIITQGILYTQAQYDSALQTGLNAGMAVGIATGRAQVTDFPNNYGLYSLTQLQALNVGTPLLAKDQVSGKFKLTIGVKKSSDLLTFTAFPIPTGAVMLNAHGEMEFQFTSPDNAAFYRLEAH